MKVLYYDCFCGISGDMNLAALLDLGVKKEYLLNELSKLNLQAEYELIIEKKLKKGIQGTQVRVELQEALKETHGVDEHGHQHHHSRHHHHEHRNLKDIEDFIQASDLSLPVKEKSLHMFRIVAEAEAAVHGKSLYEVHFHEVGAVDSMVDMVGAAICLDYLQVDTIMSSTVQVGGGFVECAHGIIPVPAPATVEILKNIPIKSGIVAFETTTPTGAAILAANVSNFSDQIGMTIERIGYGIGHRELSIPNVLRVYLGHMQS